MTLALGPCRSCKHPASWHASDRAVEPPCLRYDRIPATVYSVFSRTDREERIKWDAYPVCADCEGYQEDLHALYQRVSGRVAFRRHMCRVAGAALR